MWGFIVILLFLTSCTPTEVKVMEDIIEGEVKTGEKVMEDLSGVTPPK